jgi:hypothetical protein
MGHGSVLQPAALLRPGQWRVVMVSDADMCSASCPHCDCAWCLVQSRLGLQHPNQSRHVMSCHVHRRPRPLPTGRITAGHRHDLPGEARIFGLLHLGPQQTQACHEPITAITATTATRLHSGQPLTMLAPAVGCLRAQRRGLPSLHPCP